VIAAFLSSAYALGSKPEVSNMKHYRKIILKLGIVLLLSIANPAPGHAHLCGFEKLILTNQGILHLYFRENASGNYHIKTNTDQEESILVRFGLFDIKDTRNMPFLPSRGFSKYIVIEPGYTITEKDWYNGSCVGSLTLDNGIYTLHNRAFQIQKSTGEMAQIAEDFIFAETSTAPSD
jgi:hypothetical protein